MKRVFSLWLFAMLAICSCKRERPARKTLLPLTSPLQEDGVKRVTSISDPSKTAVYYNDTSIWINGVYQNVLICYLPECTYDSTIINAVKFAKILIPSVITELYAKKENGVVVDLRETDYQPTIRKDFLTKGLFLKDKEWPVVFLWDRA